jgi:hypothetical protein
MAFVSVSLLILVLKHKKKKKQTKFLPHVKLTDVALPAALIVKSVDDLVSHAKGLLEGRKERTLVELACLEISGRFVVGSFDTSEKASEEAEKRSEAVLHVVAAALKEDGTIVHSLSKTTGRVTAPSRLFEECFEVEGKVVLSDCFVLSPRIDTLQKVAHELRRCDCSGLFEIHVTVAGEIEVHPKKERKKKRREKQEENLFCFLF